MATLELVRKKRNLVKLTEEYYNALSTNVQLSGANIKMVNGVGNYELTYNIENPSANGFGRHADKATGVGKWWEPFSVKYTFQYTGAPKE